MQLKNKVYFNTRHPTPKPQKQRRTPRRDALNETPATQTETQGN